MCDGSVQVPGTVQTPASELRPGTYTIPEAAKRLRISSRTAYRLLRDGTFPVPTIDLRARRYVSIAVLERFLEGAVASER